MCRKSETKPTAWPVGRCAGARPAGKLRGTDGVYDLCDEGRVRSGRLVRAPLTDGPFIEVTRA